MNILTYIFAGIGVVVCLAPVLAVVAFIGCHFLAKAKLRRDARRAQLTQPSTQ